MMSLSLLAGRTVKACIELLFHCLQGTETVQKHTQIITHRNPTTEQPLRVMVLAELSASGNI